MFSRNIEAPSSIGDSLTNKRDELSVLLHQKEPSVRLLTEILPNSFPENNNYLNSQLKSAGQLNCIYLLLMILIIKILIGQR